MRAPVQLQAPSDIGGTVQAPNGIYAVPSGGVISVDPRDVSYLLGLGFEFVQSGGGSNTITLTADTDIAAGTSVSVNSAGHAVQTWGPAPLIAGTATLFSGTPAGGPSLILGPNNFVTFGGTGAQAGSIASGVISVGAADTSAGSLNVFAWGPTSARVGGGRVVAAALTAALYVLPYNDPDSSFATIAAYSVDGSNAITAGTPVSISGSQGLAGRLSNGTPGTILRLTNSTFLFAYVLADNTAWVQAGSVGGTTISLGSAVEVTTSASAALVAAIVSATEVLVVYNDGNNSGQISAVVVSISGTSCSLNTVYADASNTSNVWDLIALSSTSFLAGTYSPSSLETISLSGAVATLQYYAVPPATSYLFLDALSSSKFALETGGAFYVGDISNPADLTLIAIGKGDLYGVAGGAYASWVSGTIAVCDEIAVVADANFAIYEMASSGALSQLIEHQFLTGYFLYTLDSGHALALLLNISGIAYAQVIAVEPMNNGPIGFVSSAVSEGVTATIQISGVVPDLTDQAENPLVPGATYYHNGDGSIVTANTGHKAGVALTDSSLLIAV